MYSSCRRDIGFDVVGSFYDILEAIDESVIELRQKRDMGGLTWHAFHSWGYEGRLQAKPGGGI